VKLIELRVFNSGSPVLIVAEAVAMVGSMPDRGENGMRVGTGVHGFVQLVSGNSVEVKESYKSIMEMLMCDEKVCAGGHSGHSK
jgi:hypothetical protein